jgi:hypothetical protein
MYKRGKYNMTYKGEKLEISKILTYSTPGGSWLKASPPKVCETISGKHWWSGSSIECLPVKC